MKIKSFKLRNYKCFETFEITFKEFDEKTGNPINLHVILAPNMIGKSAVLKALRIGIGTRLQKIRANPAHPNSLNITTDEHRVIGDNPFSDKARHVEIVMNCESSKWHSDRWITSTYIWKKYKEDYTGKHSKVEHLEGNIAVDSNNAFDQVLEKKNGVIPILLYVGTEYIHQQKALTDSLDQDGSAKQGYWYCLDDKSMEAYVFEWFKKLHKTVLEQKRSDVAKVLYKSTAAITLQVFENAVKKILPDIIAVDWVQNTLSKKTQSAEYFLVFNLETEGVRTYEMLSDGYKYLVLLIGEIVTRATLLNKHLGAEVLNEINGVVLIDEFGIHLHPQLQSNALNMLSQIFPKIQFIITTHSPLLINGLKKEQIHLISENDNHIRVATHPVDDAIGLGADGILTEMFGMTTTYDKLVIDQNERYKYLLNKRQTSELSPNEEIEFKSISHVLSRLRIDPSLEIATDDPIVKMVKERMKSLKTFSSKMTQEDEISLKAEVNKIIDEIVKQ